MALGGVYETGTVTIDADRLTVTGTGTLWTPVAEVGDWLLINGQVGLIDSVLGDTHVLLESEWQGALPSGATYVLIKMSWLRYEPALTQAKLRELLAALDAQGTFLFVSGDAPDPAMGEDGQWALKTDVSPWQMWVKEDGAWVEQASPGVGFIWRGPWDSGTTYNTGDGVEVDGSTYIALTTNTNKPPAANPADWDLFVAAGDEGVPGTPGAPGTPGPPGLVWRGPWNSATNYAVDDAVSDLGSSYVAISANINSQPPGASWNLLAQAGSASIADDTILPPMLDADTGPKQLLFRDRLNFLSRAGDTLTGPLTLAADAAAALQPVSKQQLDTALAQTSKKYESVRAATTGNIAIATALNNADVLDGVTLATGNLVLVKDQTAPAENGVYIVGVTPARAPQFDTFNEHPGAFIVVEEGTANADTAWLCTTNTGGTLGTTAITFTYSPPLNAVTLAAVIHASAIKATPANADELLLVDSAAGWALKKWTWSDLKAAILAAVLASGIREPLTGPRTYYVRTDGNDANNGLTNTPGGAFLTMQKAFDTIKATIDLRGFAVTIKMAAGTYAGALQLSAWTGGGTIAVEGDTADMNNVVLSSNQPISVASTFLGTFNIRYVKFTGTVIILDMVFGGGNLTYNNVNFGATAIMHIRAAHPVAQITCVGPYTISGGGQAHVMCAEGAFWSVATNYTITLVGTPNFSSGFIVANNNALTHSTGITWSGGATGPRYSATTGGGIQTDGSGPNYYPGNAVGVVTAPGWYA